MKNNLEFVMVHVTAIDCSGTVCAYSEEFNRNGITAVDIGLSVMLAIQRLQAKFPDVDANDVGNVLVRFSNDT